MTEVLDLSKIGAPRDTVRLPSTTESGGKLYELVNPTDFGLVELQQLIELQRESDKLLKIKARTPAQERALDKTLGDAVRLLVPTVEPGVLKLLPRAAREQIILTWSGIHYAGADPVGEASSRRTTVASSRGSKRSTAAGRKSGSTSRSGR